MNQRQSDIETFERKKTIFLKYRKLFSFSQTARPISFLSIQHFPLTHLGWRKNCKSDIILQVWREGGREGGNRKLVRPAGRQGDNAISGPLRHFEQITGIINTQLCGL